MTIHRNALVRVILLFLIIWTSGVATPVAHAQSLTIEGVITVLEDAATAVENGNGDEARQLLSTLRTVTLPDGATVELVESAWDSVLDQSPESAAATLRDLASRLREPRATLPSDSRERLEAILARPEFQDAQPSLLERFLRWLDELLPNASPDVRWLYDVAVGFTGIFVISLLVIFVARTIRRNWREGEAIEALGEIPFHAAEAQLKAGAAAVAGDLREAMRLLYLAALLHLDEVGLLRFDRALTNREVLATVAARPQLHGALAPVVSQFDRVWYGHAPFGEQDFEQMKRHIEVLREMKGIVR